jgi:hypothetical protein
MSLSLKRMIMLLPRSNNTASVQFLSLCGSLLFDFDPPSSVVILNNARFTFSDF